MVRRYRAALTSRDFESAADLLDPDVTFYPPKEGLVFGRDDLRRFWAEPVEEYEHLTSELAPGDVDELPGGRCLSTSRETLRWRESGDVAAIIERGLLWTLEEGRIVEIRVFPSVGAARAAVRVAA